MSYFEKAKEKFNKLKNKKDVYVLAFESSCDDTCVALVKNGTQVLASAISSQIDIHARFGGVVPEVASRNHLLSISNLLKTVLHDSGFNLNDVDAVAVTYGAGLMGALMVSVSYAKTLAYALELPLIKVNHIKAHISANYIQHQDLKPPYAALVVSGGHTALVNVKDYVNNELIATTHDDAIGEAFDKVAKVLGLGYPGGPKIEKCALNGEANIKFINKPTSGHFENSFSFSGLKSAVINYLHKKEQNHEEICVEDVCASFQKEAIGIVSKTCVEYCVKEKVDKLVMAGGVACNKALRKELEEEGDKVGVKIIYPEPKLCTDNAMMVGAEAYYLIKSGEGLSDIDLCADPSINLKYS